jgi:phage-related protein
MVQPTYTIVFYRTASGREPVREWLQGLERLEQVKLGEDLQTLQYRWPLGMPFVKSLRQGLYELRTRLPSRICRVLFVVKGKNIVLLHGFIKKTQKTPPREIEVAEKRRRTVG